MIEIIGNQPDNVLAFTGHGRVTGKDYESILIPAVESKLKEHSKICLLYHLGEDFSGFNLRALWDDIKVGLQHPRAWKKIAVVSDNKWVIGMTKIFGVIIPCPVKRFDVHQLTEASEWLKS
ncbi:MAG: STAS/SEC14 domain-containing protein [Lyngbya sp.]|nr:STAS/SEC14 domain-containing protein [Lyngbya sp.]